MLKILIAADHAIVPKRLREILRDSPQPMPVDEAAEGAEALEKFVVRRSF
jgi:DNA-binding NarL/FixJ family response regulator